MGKSPKKEKDFDEKEFERFLNEFLTESDRAAVILGVAKLDDLLYQLLNKYLLPPFKEDYNLFGGDNRPLSTFSAKILMAYSLGLIDTDLTCSLQQIRKIRNKFAHHVTGCSFDSGSIRDLVKSLIKPFEEFPEYNDAKTLFLGEKASMPSADFRIVLTAIGVRLEAVINTLRIPERPKPLGLIPNTWMVAKSIRMYNALKGGDEK